MRQNMFIHIQLILFYTKSRNEELDFLENRVKCNYLLIYYHNKTLTFVNISEFKGFIASEKSEAWVELHEKNRPNRNVKRPEVAWKGHHIKVSFYYQFTQVIYFCRVVSTLSIFDELTLSTCNARTRINNDDVNKIGKSTIIYSVTRCASALTWGGKKRRVWMFAALWNGIVMHSVEKSSEYIRVLCIIKHY